MAKEKDLRYLPLTQVKPSESALRSVDKETEKYQELVQSIRQVGVINAISVHEMKDKETGKTVYGLIDGLHRYTGSLDAGLDTIPAQIIQADEARRLEMQIIGNLQVIETRAADYSKQLHRLLRLNPTMTALELANKLGKSITWLKERLKLIKLTDPIQELVNNSTINITNAFNLAKLPKEEQANYVDRAMTMTPNEFVPTVSARNKELRDSKRQGKSPGADKTFIPPAFLQKISAFKQELKDLAVGKGLINQYTIASPIDAWEMAIAWAIHLDPISVEISKTKDEEQRRLNDEEKAKKKAERQAKKLKEAAAVAADVSEDDEEDDE